MKIAMAMSHGKLIFVLFVVFNVTLVRSVSNQTNETDVGAVKSLDEIREYERTSNANGMNMNEIVDEQQVVKEIVDLLRASINAFLLIILYNDRLKTELRKKPSEHEELLQKKCNAKIRKN
ncbi:hypothetical protein T10_9424 [Trichinella papuae]|uniref:Uncharacterized protein n=1 Tax=Trichinella papuae TaxID=268474 RepID=A0A0V1M6A8_9BILA|nr:hypothetical protein T10_9424 [Trichinella papuae]